MAGHLKSENTPNKKKMMKRKPMMYGGRKKATGGGRMMYGVGGKAMPKAKPN